MITKYNRLQIYIPGLYMLDYSKLLEQIEQVGVDSINEIAERPVMENAQEAYSDAAINNEAFENAMDENRDLVLWPVAKALLRFGSSEKIEMPPKKYTVVGVDGSQIMPSHHEVHSCYLLNIGLCVITYGEPQKPVLESIPRLHHRPEDLYPLVDRRRIHIDELYVSLERTIFELETLAHSAIQAKERGYPVVALYDGSIIPWSIEKMSSGYQDSFVMRVESAIGQLKSASIPLLGYISQSRSSDVVNMLRTYICPYELSKCSEHCGHLSEESFPCSKIWPLTDRALFDHELEVEQFGPVFLSGAKASSYLADEIKVCFSYAKFSSEVARLEMPKWVFDNRQLLNLAMAACSQQVKKGYGYPVVLAEAHHLAVIKSQDRDQFFDMITRHLVTLGAKSVRISPKERNKRLGFV